LDVERSLIGFASISTSTSKSEIWYFGAADTFASVSLTLKRVVTTDCFRSLFSYLIYVVQTIVPSGRRFTPE